MSYISDAKRDKFLVSTITQNSEWLKVRRQFLKKNHECAVCKNRTRPEAHHKLPIWSYPELALDEDNLIPLCTVRANCHLFVGHLMSYKSFNPDVTEDAAYWRNKIENRPKWR